MSHVKGGGGGQRSVTLFDNGGGILNFVTSHFKNSVKAILHVGYQPNWNIAHWTT